MTGRLLWIFVSATSLHAHYDWFVPIAVLGGVFFVAALLGRGPAHLVAASRTALAIYSGLVACLSLYLLSSAGVAYKGASADQKGKIQLYKRTLNQFALLEAAQGRYDKLREAFLKNRDMKLVEVGSSSEFNDAEAEEQVTTLIDVLPKATDAAIKRRILATLCLFRDRIREDLFEARNLPRQATDAGAPSTNSPSKRSSGLPPTSTKMAGSLFLFSSLADDKVGYLL